MKISRAARILFSITRFTPHFCSFSCYFAEPQNCHSNYVLPLITIFCFAFAAHFTKTTSVSRADALVGKHAQLDGICRFMDFQIWASPIFHRARKPKRWTGPRGLPIAPQARGGPHAGEPFDRRMLSYLGGIWKSLLLSLVSHRSLPLSRFADSGGSASGKFRAIWVCRFNGATLKAWFLAVFNSVEYVV